MSLKALFRLAQMATGLTLFAFSLEAQDTRDVKEPHFPRSCAVLTAKFSSQAVPDTAGENAEDTARIQNAIEHCSAGGAVELKAAGGNDAFLIGPITLQPHVVLLVDANVVVFASRNPRDYDLSPGSCGVVNKKGHGCKTLIVAAQAPGSGIMGDGAIDGRGGAKLLGQQVSWWDLAHEAKVKDLSQSVPRLVQAIQSDGFTLYRITLRNSANFHVLVERTDGFTAWGVKIYAPKTARNTDGIDPSSSQNVTITHCDISTGDDDVAIKAGGGGAAAHISVVHNHFYFGHGMSIGSNTDGGVHAVRVADLSIDGADNGIRIKSDRSRGGLVEDVEYDDVCMRNVVNPIVLTPLYSTLPGDKLPVYRKILLKDVHSVTPGRLTLLGLDEAHLLDVTLDNVSVDGVRKDQIRAENAVVRIGPRRGSLAPGGQNVSVIDAGARPGAPLDCRDRFPAYPVLPGIDTLSGGNAEDNTLYVATTGSGDYSSIQRAIDAAPEHGAVISIAPGTYREALTITKPNIQLRGAAGDAARTVIVADRSAATTGSTFRSATVNVTADNFSAENLTFSNDWNEHHAQEFQGSQALALLVTGDRAVFRNVRILGNQDTLYAGSQGCDFSKGERCAPARQYFSNCYIEGNVDFIFGDGKAFFEHCEIHSTKHSVGYVTAQGKHYREQDSVFVFDRCKLTAEAGVSHVWLGRPWRPFASVVFLNTEMGGHIEPAGWREWHPGETNYIESVFYAEYNSTGPGADPARRDVHTKKLTAAEAAQYGVREVLRGTDGWDPAAMK